VVSSVDGSPPGAFNDPIAGSERTGCNEPAVRPALPIRGRGNCGGGGRNPSAAWDAVRVIQVEYEVLPFVLDVEKALQPGAPALHPAATWCRCRTHQAAFREQGFAEADVVLEETYENAIQIHSVIELHGSVVQWDGDNLIIWDSTQGVFRCKPKSRSG